MSASGKLIKMEMDYSETVDKRLPEYQEIAQVIMHMSFHLLEHIVFELIPTAYFGHELSFKVIKYL